VSSSPIFRIFAFENKSRHATPAWRLFGNAGVTAA
jgi:hypothetical protein